MLQLKTLNGLSILQILLATIVANFYKSTLFVHRNIYMRLIIRIVASRKIIYQILNRRSYSKLLLSDKIWITQ